MAENGSSKEKMLETGKMRHDVRLGKAKSSEAFRNSRASNMRAVTRSIQPLSAAFTLPRHTNRIQLSNATPLPSWTRSFHASANLRVVDLAYRLHDDSGKADGDPIVIIHGLFGSKRNNQGVGKYGFPFRRFLAVFRLTRYS
jgi:hypothetical protein